MGLTTLDRPLVEWQNQRKKSLSAINPCNSNLVTPFFCSYLQDYPGALSLSALRLAVGSLFTPSRPDIIDGADEKKQRRKRLSGAAEAASNRADLAARRRSTK